MWGTTQKLQLSARLACKVLVSFKCGGSTVLFATLNSFPASAKRKLCAVSSMRLQCCQGRHKQTSCINLISMG